VFGPVLAGWATTSLGFEGAARAVGTGSCAFALVAAAYFGAVKPIPRWASAAHFTFTERRAVSGERGACAERCERVRGSAASGETRETSDATVSQYSGILRSLDVARGATARAAVPPVRADAPGPTRLARASPPPMLADARAPALLADESLPPVLADARAPALLALGSLPPVLADPFPRALLAEIPSVGLAVHARLAAPRPPVRARTLPERRGHGGTRGRL